MNLWVILPAYNEEAALKELIPDLIETLSKPGALPFQILIVNDGSKDKTAEIASQFESTGKVILFNNPKNMGLAETLKNGMNWVFERAKMNDVVVVMDADNTHPGGLIHRMIQQIQEGFDVVIASRYRQDSRILGLTWSRQALSYIASWMFRVVFPTAGVRDFTCGYRAYRVKPLLSIKAKFKDRFIESTGFSCMVELLLRLRSERALFVELPFILRYDQKQGPSKMKVTSTIFETLYFMVKRRFFHG